MSGLLPSSQSPRANAWPKIAVSGPLVEFAHGEVAKNGENGGAGGGPGERARSKWAFGAGSRHPKLS